MYTAKIENIEKKIFPTLKNGETVMVVHRSIIVSIVKNNNIIMTFTKSKFGNITDSRDKKIVNKNFVISEVKRMCGQGFADKINNRF